MSDGWIKLHRALLDWEWYTTPNMVHFWVHCLLLANHEDGSWRGIPVKKGQFISGRKSLSANTGLSEQQVRTCIDRLKSTNELTSQSTSEYSLFTVISWEKYQSIDIINQLNNQRATSEQPASNQPSTTNKNDKNDKNDKKNISVAFAPPSIEEVKAYFNSKNSTEIEGMKFHAFYESKGWKVGKAPMKKWESAASGWILRNKTEVKANGNDLDLSKYSEDIRLRIQNAPNVLRYCAEKVHTCIYLKFRDPHMGELCREYRISNQINPINPFELTNDRKIMERYIAIMEAPIYCDQIDGISKVHGSGFYVPYGENYGRKNT